MAARGYTFQADVSTTAAQLTSVARNGAYGFTVRALSANTGKVYFGYAVTVGSTTGMELAAGESYWISKNSADDVTDLYLIASTGTQRVAIEGG